jgi:hypothetical protein
MGRTVLGLRWPERGRLGRRRALSEGAAMVMGRIRACRAAPDSWRTTNVSQALLGRAGTERWLGGAHCSDASARSNRRGRPARTCGDVTRFSGFGASGGPVPRARRFRRRRARGVRAVGPGSTSASRFRLVAQRVELVPPDEVAAAAAWSRPQPSLGAEAGAHRSHPAADGCSEAWAPAPHTRRCSTALTIEPFSDFAELGGVEASSQIDADTDRRAFLEGAPLDAGVLPHWPAAPVCVGTRTRS